MSQGNRVHAFGDDALGDLDAVAVADRIRAGEVSAAEVLDAAIERVERVNPHINAVQVRCYDRAGAQRAAVGPFGGVPTFVKDNTDVAGLPTCHGSAAFRPHPARRDCRPAQQFLAQGFTLLGKSTLPEFGLTASTEYADRPPTRNPWNTEHSPGASSGGAAALVASGAVPIAHANDGGGSIRIPAAVNGLVGLKMTRGRLLDQPGARQLPINLVSEGVVSRSVRDTAHYLAAAERFAPNRALPAVGLVSGPGSRRLRIGVISHDIFGRPVHPDMAATLTSAAETLAAQGHLIEEASLLVDPQFVEDFKMYWALFAVLMSAAFKLSHRGHFAPGDLDPFTKGLTRLVARGPQRIPGAILRLRRFTALYEQHFANVDALLTPVLAHPAPRIGEHAPSQPFPELFGKLTDYVAFTPLANIGGGPAIAIPHGMMPEGLPGSVQICGPHASERTLLELAYELEGAAPFPGIAPGDAPKRREA